MLKRVFLFSLTLFPLAYCNAQEDVVTHEEAISPHRLLYVELFGKGQTYSVNFQTPLFAMSKLALNAEIGIGYYPWYHQSTHIPISLNFSIAKSPRSSFQIGGGYLAKFRWTSIVRDGKIWNYDETKYQDVGGNTGYVKGHDEPYDDLFFLNFDYLRRIKKKYFIGFSLTPYLGISDKGKFWIFPWGGISFGKVLR